MLNEVLKSQKNKKTNHSFLPSKIMEGFLFLKFEQRGGS